MLGSVEVSVYSLNGYGISRVKMGAGSQGFYSFLANRIILDCSGLPTQHGVNAGGGDGVKLATVRVHYVEGSGCQIMRVELRKTVVLTDTVRCVGVAKAIVSEIMLHRTHVQDRVDRREDG